MNSKYDTPYTEIMSKFLDSQHILRAALHGKSQHRVLFLLMKFGDMTQRQLLDFRGITSASLSEILSKMEQNGYVERKRSTLDRRNMVITLTASGIEQAKIFAKDRKKTAERAFSVLAESERESFMKILDKFTSNLEK